MDVLTKIGTDTSSTVDRILAVYSRATDDVIKLGVEWYGEAESLVNSLSAETGYSRETIAAVIAHLSPRTTWKQNVKGAIALIRNGEKAIGIMSNNFERAIKALNSDNPIETLNGPKTRRFALNILGNKEVVTVDVWAMRVAFDGFEYQESVLSRAGVYEAIENAYQIAAKTVGVMPSEIQAITWVTIRGNRVN